MKRFFALIVSLALLCTCAVSASASHALRYRAHWLAMLDPNNRFDHEGFKTVLDQVYTEHPKLMNEATYTELSELADQCLELESHFEYDSDPFEGTLKLWPAEMERPGEKQLFSFYLTSLQLRCCPVALFDRYQLCTKAIMLNSSGSKVTLTLDSEKPTHEKTETSQTVEVFDVGTGYANLDELLNDDVTSLDIRIYAKDGQTFDYSLSESELQAFKHAYNLLQITKTIGEKLQEWCQSIDKIDE